MASKVLGYILILLGLVLLVISVKPVSEKLKLPTLPVISEIPNMYLSIAGIVLMVLGAFIGFRTSSGHHHKAVEVPIFKGKHIVGYRRTK